MGGPVVNLRQARKRKAREAAAKTAEANRITHGLKASDRLKAKSEQDKLTRKVDAHKREGALKPPETPAP